MLILVTIIPSLVSNVAALDDSEIKGEQQNAEPIQEQTSKSQFSDFEVIGALIESAKPSESEIKKIIMNTGKKLLEQEQPENAITQFDIILKFSPDYIDALNEKGKALIMLEKYDDAITQFNHILKIEPKNISALNNKGAALNYQGYKYSALIHYYTILKIEPNNKVAKQNIEKITPTITYNTIDGFVEIILYDSQRHLVGYLKSSDLQIIDDELSIKELKTIFEKKTVTRDDQKINALYHSETQIVPEPFVSGRSGITNPLIPDIYLVAAPWYQYITDVGDVLIFNITWFVPE